MIVFAAQAVLVYRVHDSSQVLVAAIHHPVVGRARPRDRLVGHAIEQAHEPPQAVVERMQAIEMTGRDIRHIGVRREVAAEVRLTDGEREVRQQESHRERPGPLVALRLRQILRRRHGHGLVVALVVGITGARAFDHRHAAGFRITAPAWDRSPTSPGAPSARVVVADQRSREAVPHHRDR